METNNELRRLIVKLLWKINDEKKLRRIYDFINQVFCRE